MNTALRDAIAEIIAEAPDQGVEAHVAQAAADRILALPEIAQAFADQDAALRIAAGFDE